MRNPLRPFGRQDSLTFPGLDFQEGVRRYSELSRGAADPEVRRSVQPVTIVYGVTENLAAQGTTLIVHREVDFDSGPTLRDMGVADFPVLAKYCFFQEDEVGKTTRWALIAGAEIPSCDDPFSSESVDPVIGTVMDAPET